MSNKSIPFTKIHIGEEEKTAVMDVLESGVIGGNGPVGAKLETWLQENFQVRFALLTTSCSHALELGAMALGIEPGDEVILPSFTFVTTASAIVRQGAKPVFVDIDERTWNIDPAKIKAHITPQTKAIIPVHYAGQGCEMERIMAIARQHNLLVIEDAAQGVGARYDGQALGTIGNTGAFSFHVTKNIVCGEGGALLTNDEKVARKAEIMREKGTNRSQFLRGEVDKYTWVELGSSFIPSDLLSAIALVQFEKMGEINKLRKQVWDNYQNGLSDLAQRGDIILPYIHSKAEINWHIYAFRVADPDHRDNLLSELKKRGIGATFHYIPLHSSPYAQKQWGYRTDDLPITELVSASLVRLPLFPDLSEEDQEFILEEIHQVMKIV